MKFSILVPVYNVEKYLEQCVESLLDQTYQDEYEIILVDDGSTDSSGIICDRYAERYPDKIKVIHKANGGHTSARLEAIRNATGDYTLFCDSDDFVERILLERIDSTLKEHPDADMVIYSFSYFENSEKKCRKNYKPDKFGIYEGESKKELYEYLLTTPYLNSLWSKAVKTEVIKNSSIDYETVADKAIAEDAYFITYYITDCKKIINIPDALYNYRILQGSISRAYQPQRIERSNTLFLFNHFIRMLPLWNMDTEEYRQKLNARWLNETMYTFRQYYEHAETAKDRKAVLNYDWSSMLPDAIKTSSINPYKSSTNRKLYSLIVSKKSIAIQTLFIKNKIYRTLRNAKSYFLNKQ